MPKQIGGVMLERLREDLETLIDKLDEEGLEEMLEDFGFSEAEDLETILEFHKAMKGHYEDFEKIEEKKYVQRGSTETPTMPRGVNF